MLQTVHVLIITIHFALQLPHLLNHKIQIVSQEWTL